MSKNSSDVNFKWPQGFAEHRAQQIVGWAKDTTAKQRLEAVEAMLLFIAKAGTPYNTRKELFSALLNRRAKPD